MPIVKKEVKHRCEEVNGETVKRNLVSIEMVSENEGRTVSVKHGNTDSQLTLRISGVAVTPEFVEELLGSVQAVLDRQPSARPPGRRSEILQNVLDRKIEDFKLAARSHRCLREAGIRFIGELVQRTEAGPDGGLLRIPSFGKKSLKETMGLVDMLGRNHGVDLTLGMVIPWWKPPVEEGPES